MTTMLHRRALIASGLAIPALAACGSGKGQISVQRYAPEEGRALDEGEGAVAIVMRRVAVEGCSHSHSPWFILQQPGRPEQRRFLVSWRMDAAWERDPANPLLIRRAFLLRLPEGPVAIVESGTLVNEMYLPWRTPPLLFTVTPRRTTYIGSLGLRSQFIRGWLSCTSLWDSSSPFFMADPARDPAFVLQQFPALPRDELDVRIASAPGWPGPPAATAA